MKNKDEIWAQELLDKVLSREGALPSGVVKRVKEARNILMERRKVSKALPKMATPKKGPGSTAAWRKP